MGEMCISDTVRLLSEARVAYTPYVNAKIRSLTESFGDTKKEKKS